MAVTFTLEFDDDVMTPAIADQMASGLEGFINEKHSWFSKSMRGVTIMFTEEKEPVSECEHRWGNYNV